MKNLLVILASAGFLCCAANDDLPPVELAEVKLAEVKLAEVPLPEIKLDAINTVSIISSAEIKSDTTVDNIAAATIPLARIAIATLPDTSAQLAEAAALIADKKNLFRDQRTFFYDMNADSGNQAFAEWRQVYKTQQNYTAEYVPLQQGLRMVAEVRLPCDTKVLDDNIAYYKGKGYNSILITFDGSEEPWQLANLADRITASGLRPWYAFGGDEDLKLSVWIRPAKLRQIVAALAARCDGTLLHWRRTSQHLFLPDRAFVDFLISCGREINPRLQILGEGYFGETSASVGKFAVTTSVPDNSSGVALLNVGFSCYDPQKVFDKLFPMLKNTPKVAVILGEAPYYATKFRNNLDFEQNWEIKRRVEEKFIKAGAVGTITLHGDGSNGLYDRKHTDNLGHTVRDNQKK